VVVIQLMPTDQAKAEGAKSSEEEFKDAHGGSDKGDEKDDDLD
jgi:hypothetical protein